MKTNLFTLMLLLAVTACKKTEATEADMADTVAVAAVEMAAPVAEDVQYKAEEPVANDASLPEPPPPPEGENVYEVKIIKNANLRFETPALEATEKRIKDAVKKYNGLIINDAQSKEYYKLSHHIRLRVPSAHFEHFIATISQGVDYFEQKEITSQDVTEEYIDADARIKTKKILETRYLELLKKASKVSEMLEIEKELSTIREEIEAQQGRLKYLKSQVAMSTINIEFYKNTERQEGVTESYGSKIITAFKSGFNSLSTFLLNLLNIWPFILIFVILFIIIRKRIRKRKNHAK